jgi:hypothetical protein
VKPLFLPALATFALLLAQVSFAQTSKPVPKPDGLSIGSYPYFVALNKRCGASSPERSTALSALRKQSIGLAQSIIPMLAASVKHGGLTQAQFEETKSKLADMEMNWPELAEVARFDTLLDESTPADIESMCEDMPKAISQRLELNALLLRTNAEMAEMMKKAPAPK